MRLGWPRSLFARNFLVLIALAIVLEFSIFVVVYQLLQKPRAQRVANLVASQITTLDEILSQVPPAQREQLIEQVNRSGNVHFQTTPPTTQGPTFESVAGLWMQQFGDELRSKLPPRMQLQTPGNGFINVNLQIDGRPYWVMLPIDPIVGWRAMALAIAVSALISSIALAMAWLLQRRIARPLLKLQHASQLIGAGQVPERLPENGPSELADVARQFNRMADALEQNEATRSLMLAGISHDIRTPLTKLRLAFAMGRLSEDEFNRYITHIDAIVGQFVDFGRAHGDEPAATIELNTLVRQLASEFEERGQLFDLQLDETLPSQTLPPLATQRAIANLMENAVRYGREQLSVCTRRDGNWICVDVRDRGPGIPPDQVAHLLRPFTRAEAARSNAGGTGLGLAIVDRLARHLGGGLTLQARHGGGLCAVLRLPTSVAPIVRDHAPG